MNNQIIIKGARENNLKNVNLTIPRNKLIVMTGVSGSGKSSLAFDTIYAEGQRRYVESLSAYARQFLDNVDKPDVDVIEGLSPAISIDQKTTSRNPRSTVGTVTEIYDYLRLLYARIGRPHCPIHHHEISSQTIEQMCNKVFEYPQESRVVILSPIAEERKGTFEKTIEILRKDGYSKAIIDGEMMDLDEEISLEKNVKHNILVVIDRIKIRPEIRSRLYESLETASKLGEGKIYVEIDGERIMFSEHYSCPDCGFTIGKLEPAMFSFNSPLGACPNCKGLGFTNELDIDRLIVNPEASIADGAIRYLKNIVFTDNIEWQMYKALFEKYKIDVFKPYKDLTDEQKEIILYGSKEPILYEIHSTGGISMKKNKPIEGLASLIKRRYEETESNMQREYYGSYMKEITCPVCNGKRLSQTVLSVLIKGKNIYDFTEMSILEALDFIDNLNLTEKEKQISQLVIKEIKNRLQFLKNVGLEYLTLSRKAGTLSGGEAQRIRLATQIGSHLTGVLYVLDEPSIGLHQSDNHKLINSLKEMRDLDNTLIVVEHDEEIMHECDYIVDIGPYAGVHGGEVVAQGTIDEIMANPRSITGDYLSGRRKIEIPTTRITEDLGKIVIKNAHHNNLKNIDVEIPLHKLVLVTGVSGSGKSSLVNDILYNTLAKTINHSNVVPGESDGIEGINQIERVIQIDQSPIGRTPRSNPATYTGVFDAIRDLFATTLEAKKRGYTKSRFSFNVKGGRCETCQGDGVIRIAMHFLPDVYVECEACHGKRYNYETLEVKYKDKSISDVLDMTVEEACSFFENIPQIYTKMKTLNDVGLGYIKLGQSATTLSGGEAQRVKLASELHKKVTENTMFIFDEPTTGLHTYDVDKLMKMIQKIVKLGASVVIIEHNLDVIKLADYIIDLGPSGGNKGGHIIATGTPEEIVKCEDSLTGQYLKKVLERK
ncbi:MAG: excinuclease ABC subunit UvrA [Bacilli bacterium]|nr:excinuclease ABC subunit UvrA [Bacilli bacterium]MDD7314328.1 excinuclease ABC subunit UvrA [Bacilli bacterium]MDY4052880.1 excinuclease ABC subunit UvrA [Bacilli bacterium]